MFRVAEEFVIYSLEDIRDKCLPLQVEGKWHLQESKDEELEDLVERAIREDLDEMSEVKKEDIIADNDVLIDELETEMDHLTKDQLKYLSDITHGREDRLEKLKDRQRKRWDTNYIDYDIEKKRAEQGDDWYHQGKRTKHAVTEEAKQERRQEHQAVKESYELKGFLYGMVFFSLFGAIYYYFCIRRKRLRNQQQYAHVTPSQPTFA